MQEDLSESQSERLVEECIRKALDEIVRKYAANGVSILKTRKTIDVDLESIRPKWKLTEKRDIKAHGG